MWSWHAGKGVTHSLFRRGGGLYEISEWTYSRFRPTDEYLRQVYRYHVFCCDF